jgi:hypothetical protein
MLIYKEWLHQYVMQTKLKKPQKLDNSWNWTKLELSKAFFKSLVTYNLNYEHQ